MRNNDTVFKTIFVAITLCLICSAIISSAAVGLRDLQEANQKLDKQSKVLASARLLDKSKSIEELFLSIKEKIIDLDTGEFIDSMDLDSFNESSLARDDTTSIFLTSSEDIALIKRRENYQKIYLHYSNETLKSIILPVRGYGLWGTLYGYLAVKPDLQTIIGLEFFQHKETPGLGAEVDNPRWKALWRNKKIYGDTGEVLISVVKGTVNSSSALSDYQVDGLSGATITSKGVSNLLTFWLGELGYLPFIKRFKKDTLIPEKIDV